MKQLLFIHGGNLIKDDEQFLQVLQTWEVNPFVEKKRRRLTLQERLPEFMVIKPEMPNKDMARYAAWKLRFEKYLPFLEDEELIVVGHSLGAMFLVKYLSENTFPLKIAQLHLVAPVLNDQGLNEGDNYLGDFAYQEQDIINIASQAEHITIWASKDDPCVPYIHSVKIHEYLPGAELKLFEDRAHFNQEEFPELIEMIRK